MVVADPLDLVEDGQDAHDLRAGATVIGGHDVLEHPVVDDVDVLGDGLGRPRQLRIFFEEGTGRCAEHADRLIDRSRMSFIKPSGWPVQAAPTRPMVTA